MRMVMPIGVDDFAKVRRGFYFVDKTNFLREFVRDHAEVTLFTRPRRFGKTLTMLMLRYFFSIEDAQENLYGQGKLSQAQLQHVMDHCTIMQPDAFSGYAMGSNGQAQSILDTNVHELLTKKIDTVSYKIEQQYWQLFDIDNAGKEDVD
ncbi:MAG: AAA family ATPase [Selenomonadaceae bacterium]|nr:AAA family ATPase [Selenomonadaceae bacterium]